MVDASGFEDAALSGAAASDLVPVVFHRWLLDINGAAILETGRREAVIM